MEASPGHARELRLDEDGLIAEDIACPGCGTSLRRHAPTADCIECGRPIAFVTADGSPSLTPGLTCADCGRTLTLSEVECCRKCGLPVSVSRAAGAAPEPDGVLTSDVPCRQCGYNLRGLRGDGQCPECSTPVAMSTREDLLCFAEPTYVTHVARGVHWIAIGLILILVSIIPIAAFGSLWNVTAAASGVDWGPIFMAAMAVCPLAALLLMLFGLWRLSQPPPTVDAHSEHHSHRLATRIVTLLGLLGLALSPALVRAHSPPWLTPVWFGLFAMGIVAAWTHFRRVRDIAARIPDQWAVKRASSLGRTIAVACSIALLDTLVRWLYVRFRLPGGPPAGPVGAPSAGLFLYGSGYINTTILFLHLLAGIARLCLLVCFFLAMRYHLKLRAELQRQAELARRHWCIGTEQA